MKKYLSVFIFLLLGSSMAFAEIEMPTDSSSAGAQTTVEEAAPAKSDGWQIKHFFLTLKANIGMGKGVQIKAEPLIYFAWTTEADE